MPRSAVRTQILRAAAGTAAGGVLITAGLYTLSVLGIGVFDYKVAAGAALGCLTALGNFTALCLTIQKAALIPDRKRQQAFVQASYNIRLTLQALWAAAAYLSPHIHTAAGLLPLLLPAPALYLLSRRDSTREQ